MIIRKKLARSFFTKWNFAAIFVATLTLMHSAVPQAVFAFDVRKYNALLESAKNHCRMLDFEGSIKDLTAAIKLNPTSYYPYLQRSEAYRELNLMDEGIADLTSAIACAKDNIGLYRDRGFLYLKNGQYKEALADYTKALQINPHDEISYRFRARTYSVMKNYKAAAADYKKSLEFVTKNSLRLEPQTRGLLGDLYVKANMDKEALEQFNLMIKKFPKVSKGYYGRAAVYRLEGKTELAKKDTDRAHELDYEFDPGLRDYK